MPGLEVLQRWRDAGNPVPVIVLTARDAWHERVTGFKAGADDYSASLPRRGADRAHRALLRRRGGQAGPSVASGDLRLDEDRQEAVLPGGEAVPLTGTEFRLLRASC